MAKTESLFPILDSLPRHSILARAADTAPLDSTGCLTEYRPYPDPVDDLKGRL